MDWITGIQNAVDYIEQHLTEELSYEEIARQSFSSPFHFQRVFSILCGYTLGEYIRCRRLTLAGTELATEKKKVIDVAYKYGYDTPESFAKAFRQFHGITPSQARGDGARLKSFSRLTLKITLEGGSIMDYRIEQKEQVVLQGYKRRFSGSPKVRDRQDHEFICETRLNQAVLQYMAHDVDTLYGVFSHFDDEGYDYHVAAALDEEDESIAETMGEEIARRFERIVIPAGTYLICQTQRCKYPADLADELYRQAVTQWLPSSGYELADGPEVEVIHWYYRKNDEALNASRYLELWLPIAKK